MVRTNQKLYDAKQTLLCDRLRERLQSIAILAVKAQDKLGEDSCSDLIDDIVNDAKIATSINNDLCMDKILCDACGAHLMKHDQKVCDSTSED